MKNALFITITIFLASCSTKEVEAPAKEPETVQEPVEIQNWMYQSSFNKMEGDSTYFATAVSTNVATFDFPYDGGSTLSLILRKTTNATDVCLQISKGQFNDVYTNGSVNIKFDNETASSYRVTGSSTGNPDVLFIKSTDELIAKLKASKKALIEAAFYNHGSVVFEFDVAALKWNH